MKKLGLLFAVIVMSLMFAVSVSALEPTGQCGDNVYWEYDETTGELVISGEGDMWDYYQTQSPFYKSVIRYIDVNDGITSVGGWTFYNCVNLKSVVLPNSLININYSAFSYCKSLESLMIPSNVTNIGNSAFSSCSSLESVTFLDSKAIIGEQAFRYCEDLKSVELGNSITSIGAYSFMECDSLNKIVIPNSVTYAGEGAFAYCPKLVNLTLSDNLEEIGSAFVMGCERLEELIVSNKVKTFYTSAVYECSNLRRITIKNPECEIVLNDCNLPPQTILSGYIDSTAEQYAYENNYHFLPLDGENAGIIQNHKYTADWKSVLPANCTERGLKIRVCNTCSDVESQVIIPLGHIDDNNDYKCDYNCGYEYEKPAPEKELNFFQKIVQWFKDIFDKLFGWMK